MPSFFTSLSATLNAENSAYMSTPFDVGGILGAIMAGVIADRTGASGLTCIVMLIFAIPSVSINYRNFNHFSDKTLTGLLTLQLYIYLLYGGISFLSNIALQFVAGAFVNGPYALITTAVAADLGNTVTSSKAMATVTAIIDGTGSIGAAIGPLMAGLISKSGWQNVFYFVMIADFISLLLLLRIGRNEIRKLRLHWSRTVV